MPTKEILTSYSVLELRKEVSKTNLKGYSKMKKSEVVELMMKPNNKPKFHHIKAKTKATKAKAAPPAPSLVTEAPKKTYKFKKKEKAKPSSVGIAVVPAKKKTAGEKLTGLTKAEMNKLSPSELFGQLPVALAKKVLTSGTKVGRVPIKIQIDNVKVEQNTPVPKYASFRNWLKGMGVKTNQVNDKNIKKLIREYQVHTGITFGSTRRYWEGETVSQFRTMLRNNWKDKFSESVKKFIQDIAKK